MSTETFTVTEAHVEYLKDNKIFYHPSGTYPPGWFKLGLRYRAPVDLWVEPWTDHRSGPMFSELGAFSYSRSSFANDARIGRYCAIGENVSIMRPNHPTDRVAMCGFDYENRPSPFGPYARETGFEFPLVPLPKEVFIGGVEIGPDVWIGSNALISRGVKIGAGAIIAANSVVTRDVEPYTLVAGNPARAKKRRFSDDLCERLLASKWWEYSFDAFVGMETTNPERFLDQFGEAVSAGRIAKMPENRINIHAALREITARQLEEQGAAKLPVETVAKVGLSPDKISSPVPASAPAAQRVSATNEQIREMTGDLRGVRDDLKERLNIPTAITAGVVAAGAGLALTGISALLAVLWLILN